MDMFIVVLKTQINCFPYKYLSSVHRVSDSELSADVFCSL